MQIKEKQMELNETVKGVVEGFILSNTPFSVYDITTSIRALANAGALNIPELAVSGQNFEFGVEHADVRKEFADLFSNGGFSTKLNRRWAGQFFQYEPVKSANIGRAKASSGLVSNLNRAVAPTPKSTGKLDKPEVTRRVRTYLLNCDANNFTPTLKQIQSAIKRGNKSTGWSRQDLDVIRREIRTSQRKKN